MKQLFPFLIIMASLISCSADAQKPTKDDVTKAIKSTFERAQTSSEPKKTVTINDIKFGDSEKSNLDHQFDGVPKGSVITHAKIDFTQNLFYSNETQHVRRVMTAYVYKDHFGEWEVMNAGVVYPDK